MKAAMIVAIALGMGAPRDADETAREIARLQGEWEVQHAEKNGLKLNEDDRRKLSEFFLTKAAFDGEMLQVWIQHKGGEAKPSDMIPYSVDVGKKPRQMKFDKFVAIYALDGDVLRVCFTDDPEQQGTAPESFDTNRNEKAYLFVFKKAKK